MVGYDVFGCGLADYTDRTAIRFEARLLFSRGYFLNAATSRPDCTVASSWAELNPGRSRRVGNHCHHVRVCTTSIYLGVAMNIIAHGRAEEVGQVSIGR